MTLVRALAALCAMGAGVSAAALPSASFDQAVPTGRSTYRLPVADPAADHVNYILYVPQGAHAPATGWPLILFLHGTEQRGDDPSVLLDLDILTFADEEGQFPFVAVVPQCPAGQHWSPSVLKQLLDAVQVSLAVDRSRVYLTGFSMGGYGVWQTAAALPGTFAAIAPLCGMSDVPDAPALAKVPAWVFHGARDQNVPISESQKMVKALRRAGGDPMFTVYPDSSHDIWTMTYHDSRLYLWFLSHSLAEDSPSADSRIAASSLSSDALLDR
jgi:predicted peptidase